MSAYTDLIDAINSNVTAPLLDSQKIADNDKLILDYLLNQNDDDFPDWTSGQTFQTDGSDDGIYCKYADTNGRKRIFETKTDNNIGNAPPTDPGITETTHWRELSQSAAASIPEYAAGVFGTGLKMVFFDNDIYKLEEPVRPFTSSNLLTELAAGKWRNLTRRLNISITSDLDAITQNGFYYANTGASNKPIAANGYFLHQILDFNFAIQTYWDRAALCTYIRNKNSGVWSAWKKQVNTDDLIGLYDDRGAFDASGGAYPTTGGSGASGAILKGDIWRINVAGTLPGGAVIIGQTIRALVDSPGNTAGNWHISVGGGSFTAASVAEINTGTDNAKTVTALGLEGSKYENQQGSKTFAVASGTNTYTASLAPAIAAYATGQRIFIRFTNANTAASTLNLNGLGAISIQLEGRALLAGDIKAGQTYVLAYDGTNFQIIGAGKMNRGSNTEYETLADASSVYRFSLLSRLGAIFKTLGMEWDESLGQLRFTGTTAILRAGANVTAGNFGIKLIQGVLNGFSVFDDNGDFLRFGVDSDGRRKIFSSVPIKRLKGTVFLEDGFISEQVIGSATTTFLTIPTESNSIITISIEAISIQNIDKDYIIGRAIFNFKNNAGTVTDISLTALCYDEQYSTIRATDGYVTNSDTRIQCVVSGTNVLVQFINNENKICTVQFDIDYTITPLPL